MSLSYTEIFLIFSPSSLYELGYTEYYIGRYNINMLAFGRAVVLIVAGRGRWGGGEVEPAVEAVLY